MPKADFPQFSKYEKTRGLRKVPISQKSASLEYYENQFLGSYLRIIKWDNKNTAANKLVFVDSQLTKYSTFYRHWDRMVENNGTKK